MWPHRRQPARLPVPGILQERTLEWVAISFSSAWKWKVKVKSLSHVRLLATPWTDCSLPGSSVHGIFQARVLEWGASYWLLIENKKIWSNWLCLGVLTEKAMATTPVLLPWKSHGRRSLVGCSPGGCEESDTTEWLHFHFSVSCIGGGNGNPLQCSCLENPRDGEPGGLPSMGSHRVGHDWSDLAQLCEDRQKFIRHLVLIYCIIH